MKATNIYRIIREIVREAAPAVLPVVPLALLAACSADQEPAHSGTADGAALITLTATAQPQDILEATTGDGTRSGDTHGATRATENDANLQNVALRNGANLTLYFNADHAEDAAGASVTRRVATAGAPNKNVNTLSFTATYMKHGELQTWIDAAVPTQAENATVPDLNGAATQTFSVMQDQSDDDGYRASDLMAGSVIVSRAADATAASGRITLQHRMAKIRVTVNIPAATSYPNFTTIKGVRLVSGYRTCNFLRLRSLEPGTTLSDEIGELASGRALALYGGTATTGGTGTATTALTVSCLIPPQVIGYTGDDYNADHGLNGDATAGTVRPDDGSAASRAFLEVETDRGTTRYRFTQPQPVRGGYCYALTVTPHATPGAEVYLTGWTAVAGDITVPQIAATDQGFYYVGSEVFKMVKVEAPGTAFSATLTDCDAVAASAATQTMTVSQQLDSDYWLGETKVTEGLWKAVMGGDITAGRSAEHPRMYVTWLQAIDFCQKLNTQTEGQRPPGYRFCLPSIAEWVYAAQGGKWRAATPNRWPGTDTESALSNYMYTGDTGLYPVGQKIPNELGLYDMGSNGNEYPSDIVPGTSNIYLLSAPNGRSAVQLQTLFFWGMYAAKPNNTAYEFRGLRVCLRRAKVGDLLYSDGTWGTAQEYPGRTPVAIVFKGGTSDADSKMGYRGGYAMALKNSGTWQDAGYPQSFPWAESGTWPAANTIVDSQNIAWSAALADAGNATLKGDYDGLTRCRSIVARAEIGNYGPSLTAIRAAMNYAHAAAPLGTSGWYLPSIGQTLLWMEAFGKGAQWYDSYFPAVSKTWQNYPSSGAIHIAANPNAIGSSFTTAMNSNIKEMLTTAYESRFEEFPAIVSNAGDLWNYWTSTECTNPSATGGHATLSSWHLSCSTSDVRLWSNNTRVTQHFVRPVIAF